MKRDINYIVVHCTATPPDMPIATLRNYWKEHLGLTYPPFYYLIKRDGTIINLLSEDQIANGVLGFNCKAIHIAYIGGIDRDGKPLDNRTEAQSEALFNQLIALTERYPKAVILGHRDLPNQTCASPCFDVKQWLSGYVPPVAEAA